MSRAQKFLAVFLAITVLFFGFIVFRVWGAKPPATVKLTPIPQGEYDPAVWGKYYGLEYQTWLKNKEMAPSPTGYGGSVKEQKSVKQTALPHNFKGYPFEKDYTEDRGHPYSLEDLRTSHRIGPTSKGSCITCKTPQIEQFYKEMGWGYTQRPLSELLDRSQHPVSCGNCHNPETMALRVINPAFIEGQARRGIDVTKASREEMRSYVCGQCHAEYYFVPGTFQVVFPWDKGLTPSAMYEYYSANPNNFTQDWQHADSKAPMLKAQHPDFEEWQNGTHGKAGVSCADCHMPYMRQQGRKYTSHWVTSPLKHLNEACSTCHNEGPEWLFERVKTIQDNVWQLQHLAEQKVSRAHTAIKKASETANVNQTELANARELVRKAQWYWDYVAAANSMGFHNSVQELNTLGQAIDFANLAIEAANRAAGTNTL
ncbi:Nitrite reductase (cytochrome; ammonia-forming) [Thermosinus carboxydivorans Nor1]|uniref:nitrite reductase (cytochrome; ammonia-forming) n=1 Tax=Thermosinus carboxydivorans Nor1 TaxID=401526 RepID=A1HUI1_9FIRM|nr:ammonia-forming cytochrome c nitrite reductase subunit c552 [Thermosinus carboxydivorans]EAX46312.1 Nitrite reductase (cytochrome; ammonia-forming) [Thermosinus carboxydivorans Nor1]